MQNAQPVVAEIDKLAEQLRRLGLPVEVAEMTGGNSAIRASSSGIPFSAFLFKNEEQKSPYLMLSAMFPGRRITHEWANTWNNRFSIDPRSVTPEGEPMLTQSVILTGIDSNHLKEVVSWWDLLLRIFVEDVMSASH